MFTRNNRVYSKEELYYYGNTPDKANDVNKGIRFKNEYFGDHYKINTDIPTYKFLKDTIKNISHNSNYADTEILTDTELYSLLTPMSANYCDSYGCFGEYCDSRYCLATNGISGGCFDHHANRGSIECRIVNAISQNCLDDNKCGCFSYGK